VFTRYSVSERLLIRNLQHKGEWPRYERPNDEFSGGVWNVYFGPLKLGRFHERHMRIEDEYGRLTRHNMSPMSLD